MALQMPDFIYSRLFGGAGNQLFQYAAGRALADKLGCELILDSRYLADGSNRGDCFAHFQNARFACTDDLPPAKSDGLLRYGLWRKFGKSPRFVREKGLGFNAGFFDLPTDTYLHGYWQSPRYFGPQTKRLRQDLTFTTSLTPENAEIAAQIADTGTAVSIHVRRGDYVATAAGSHSTLSPEYYLSAAAQITEQAGPITCFVFSNDPAWARDNLNLDHPTVIVDINDETTGHFDLHLQSLCAHNIIANSTFSWWAAWLNPNPDKIVVAPKLWFANPKLANPDLLPPAWVRM